MDIDDVFTLLEESKNERGITNWKKLDKSGLSSFGIGLTQLRKIAKKIGLNEVLAAELWRTDSYDAKVISLLIDNPKTMSREQAERQVEELEGGYLIHVFSSCDATLGKTDFVEEIINDWISAGDPVRVRCGFGLLYELSKSIKKSAPNDDFFLNYLDYIGKHYKGVGSQVLLSMGLAIQGIGGRNINLYRPALELAKRVGPIDFSEDGQKCDPYDVVKHLTSDYIIKKFNL